MTIDIDLYDSFAKAVNEFGSDSAESAAHHLAELTSSRESGFMYHESNTWNLIALLAETKSKSSLCRLASLKQWVSQITFDSKLLERIKENKDVDNEIMTLFEQNGILDSSDTLEPPRKKRLAIIRDDGEEKLKQQYTKLRSNDLTPIKITGSGDVSLNYLINKYLQYQKMALMGEGGKVISRERDIWRKAVLHELQNVPDTKYRKIILAVIAGDSQELYNTVCDTWEDVIWAFLNQQVEQTLDDFQSAKDDGGSIVSDTIASIALSKDEIMDRDDPRIFFHYIQLALLSNDPQSIIRAIYLRFSNNTSNNSLEPAIYISENTEERAQILRFLSTFIIFGCQYLGWQETLYSATLLSAYAELNSSDDVMRPVVIAAYAAKESPQYQIKTYSTFLQNFDGDDEECSILLQLGKEYGLDMRDILQYTYTHLFKRAISKAPAKIKAKPVENPTLELEGTVTDDYITFIQAIKWLTLDESMCIEAFQAANMTIRYLLGLCKIYVIRDIFNLFSDTILERMSFESTQHINTQKILAEYDSHRTLVDALLEYEEWDELIENKPKDNGTVDDLLEVHKWQDKIQRKSMDLTSSMSRIMDGHWLDDDVNETAHISKATLRQIYVPEIVTRYRRILKEMINY